MEQVKRYEFFDLSSQLNYVILNAILSLLYLIAIYVGFIILLSTFDDLFKFIFVFSIVVILLAIRFSFSIVFGFRWKNNHNKYSKNYTLMFFTVAGFFDLLLIVYYIFYFQINDAVSSEILFLILAPIGIITVASLLISGIENVLYAFMLGLVSIALFVDPANVHHTMAEFVIMYSLGSTIILSPFYVLPSLFLGTVFNKINNDFFKTNKYLKLVLLTFIPLLLISLAHIGFYSLVFGMW